MFSVPKNDRYEDFIGGGLETVISFLVFILVILVAFPWNIYAYKCMVPAGRGVFGISRGGKFVTPAVGKLVRLIDGKIRLAGMCERVNAARILKIQMASALIGWILGTGIYCPAYGCVGCLIGLFISALLALYPVMWLDRKGRERKARITGELPGILTNIAVVTDAGLNLQQALIEVARLNEGEAGAIFRKVVQDVDMGKPIVQALEEIPELEHVEELNRVVSVIVWALRKGSAGITKILREQAALSWERRKNKLKEAGQKTSFKLFLPVYLLIFPAVGLLVIAPAVMGIMNAFAGR